MMELRMMMGEGVCSPAIALASMGKDEGEGESYFTMLSSTIAILPARDVELQDMRQVGAE